MKSNVGVLKKWIIRDAAKKLVPRMQDAMDKMSEDELRAMLVKALKNLDSIDPANLDIPEDAIDYVKAMAPEDVSEMLHWVKGKLQEVLGDGQ